MRKILIYVLCLLFTINLAIANASENKNHETLSGSTVMNNWGSSAINFSKIIKKELQTQFTNGKNLFHWWILERVVFPKIGLPTKSIFGYPTYKKVYLPDSFSVKSVGNEDFLTFYKNRLMAYYTELDAKAYQDYVEKLKSKYGTGSTKNMNVYANAVTYAEREEEYRLTVSNWNQNGSQIFLIKSYTEWGMISDTSVYLLYLNSPMLDELANEVAANVKSARDKANAANERSKKENLKKID